MSEETGRVFNLEQAYLFIGEHYEKIRAALHPALLDPTASVDEDTVFRLGLITAFQYAENLDDWTTAQATSQRSDWRYALHLPHKHPGFSSAQIGKFRAFLRYSTQAMREFAHMLRALRKTGLFSIREKTLTAEKVISRVCHLNHFVQLKRAMKTALSALVATDPHWLSANALPHWYERYKSERPDLPLELSDAEIQEEALGLGRDIHHLLTALQAQSKTRLAAQPEVQVLMRLLAREFIIIGDRLSWNPRCSPRANLSNPGLVTRRAYPMVRPLGEMVITGILARGSKKPKPSPCSKTQVILLWGCNDALAAEVSSFLSAQRRWKVVRITGHGDADSLSQAVRRLNPDIVILLDPCTDTTRELTLLLKEQPNIRVVSMIPESLTVDVFNKQKVWVGQLSDLISILDS